MDKKPKPIIVDTTKKEEKILLVNQRGEALIIERPRQVGFRMENR